MWKIYDDDDGGGDDDDDDVEDEEEHDVYMKNKNVIKVKVDYLGSWLVFKFEST